MKPNPRVEHEIISWTLSMNSTRHLNGVLQYSVPASVPCSRDLAISKWSNGPDWQQLLSINPVLVGELFSTLTEIRCPDIPNYILEYRNNLNGDQYVERTYLSFAGVSPTAYDIALTDKELERARKSLLDRYHQASRSVQGLVVVGEAVETVHTLARPGIALINATKVYLGRTQPLSRRIAKLLKKRGGSRSNWATLVKLNKRLSDEWLYYSFGVSPILADIESAAKFYNKRKEEKSEFVTFRSKDGFGHQSGPPPIVLAQTLASGVKFRAVRKDVSTCIVKLRSAIKIALGPGPAMSTIQNSGLTFRDFVPSVYELIPYSWFLDYLTNMSDIIDAWSFGDAFPYGIQQTLIRKTESRINGIQLELPADTATWQHTGLSWNTTEGCSRRAGFSPIDR